MIVVSTSITNMKSVSFRLRLQVSMQAFVKVLAEGSIISGSSGISGSGSGSGSGSSTGSSGA